MAMNAAARRAGPIFRASILGTLTAATTTTTTSYISRSGRPTSSSSLHLTFLRPFSYSALPILPRRSFASSSPAGSIIVVKSADELNSSLTKAQDDGVPAIFYFTAAWCGPCRFISPVIEELSKKYPHVTTYKIDIDLEGLGNTLNKLQISAVPTLHFFQGGKKANEMVGADINQLRETMESLYRLLLLPSLLMIYESRWRGLGQPMKLQLA